MTVGPKLLFEQLFALGVMQCDTILIRKNELHHTQRSIGAPCLHHLVGSRVALAVLSPIHA